MMTTQPSTPSTTPTLKQGPIDLVKHRAWYLISSALLVLPGLGFMGYNISTLPEHAPLKLGIDFVGGTLLEFSTQKPLSQEDVSWIRKTYEEAGFSGTQVQLKQGVDSVKPSESQPSKGFSVRLRSMTTHPPKTPVPTQKTPSSNVEGTSLVTQTPEAQALKKAHVTLESHFGKNEIKQLQKLSIGPTMAQEILSKGILALVLAYALIVGYLTLRFQFDYALCAILALFHDTLFVLGIFAMLGTLFGVEVDALFITGILTVIGFSVHDTIVVFDRIRENMKRYYTQKLSFATITNMSINQTLARSINTSLTAVLTLLAMLLFGGDTTRQFVLVMFLGILVGTYSSIFFASLLLTWLRDRQAKPMVSSSRAS
ncbi:MAG: protein translocase subunit SecF [Vampirovibrionales bacterium]